jgi:hypothetical protein
MSFYRNIFLYFNLNIVCKNIVCDVGLLRMQKPAYVNQPATFNANSLNAGAKLMQCPQYEE